MSVTSYATEHTLILDTFRGLWDETSYPVAWPNVSFQAKDDANGKDGWARITVRPTASQQASHAPVGTRTFRFAGRVFVEVFTRPNLGVALNDELIDRVVLGYAGLDIGGVVCGAPRKVHRGLDDGWFSAYVEIPYTRDSAF